MWRNEGIFIGPRAIKMNTTEVCNYKPMCELFITNFLKATWEIYALYKGQIHTFQFGIERPEKYDFGSGVFYRALCQANFLDIKI